MSPADPDNSHSALLDACTLIPIRLTTTLLWLAEAGLFEVLWSDAILDEVERNLPKVGISSEQAARRIDAMRRGFGAAALVDDFERLIPDMTCDVKDRHVLAAAVRRRRHARDVQPEGLPTGIDRRPRRHGRSP